MQACAYLNVVCSHWSSVALTADRPELVLSYRLSLVIAAASVRSGGDHVLELAATAIDILNVPSKARPTPVYCGMAQLKLSDELMIPDVHVHLHALACTTHKHLCIPNLQSSRLSMVLRRQHDLMSMECQLAPEQCTKISPPRSFSKPSVNVCLVLRMQEILELA